MPERNRLKERQTMKKKAIKWIIALAIAAVVIFLGWKTVTDWSFSLLMSHFTPSDEELSAQVEQAMENGVLPTPEPSADPASEPTQQPEDAAPTQEPAGNGQSKPSQPITMDYALKNMGKIQSKMSSGDKSAIMSIVISRLTADDKRQIAEMMKDGISGSDMSAGMAIARQRLTGSDISQILSIVQKYAGENE